MQRMALSNAELVVSLLCSRYFGGRLELVSLDGWGLCPCPSGCISAVSELFARHGCLFPPSKASASQYSYVSILAQQAPKGTNLEGIEV